MTRMANEHGAINLSQGFPDFNCASALLDLFRKYQEEGKNQYSPMPGVPELRKMLSKKIRKLYGGSYDMDTEITVTSGATQALYSAAAAFIHPGDEVIIFEPAYDSYLPNIRVHGGVPVPIPLLPGSFRIDWDEVRSKLSKKTRMIIINSPHNPSGALLTRDDITELTNLTSGTNILILSDEVYEHITFDGNEHLSLAGVPELRERALVVSSFGKTYHTTGWKVGWLAADAALAAEFRRIHQFVVYCVNTPAQYAFAEYMLEEEHQYGLAAFYQKKRDVFNESLDGSRFTITPAKGTYFQLLDYSDITDLEDSAFAEKLTKEAGVAVIPLSPFYVHESQNRFIRICFAKNEDTLRRGAEKLAHFVAKM